MREFVEAAAVMMDHHPSDRIADLPTTVTSPRGKLVYLYLEASGGATVADLNDTLAMNKLAVLSVLESLTSQGLVEKTGTEYVVTA